MIEALSDIQKAGTSAFSAGGGGSGSLDGLTDVVITTPQPTQTLTFNGTTWVNSDGGISTESTTLNQVFYPIFTDVISASTRTTYTDPVGLSYEPALGRFNAPEFWAAYVNSNAVEAFTMDLQESVPAVPATGFVRMFCKKIAERFMAAMVGPSGLDVIIQPALFRQKIARWNPPGNSTTLPGVDGFTAPTTLGTVTARNVAVSTNLLTRMKRLGYASAATAAAFCGHWQPAAGAQLTTGDGAGKGGFFYSCRFAITDPAAVAGARFFAGLSNLTVAPTNVEPSTLTNCIGIAQLSTSSTQLYLVYGGTAAQTAIALGTNFPPMQGVGAGNGVAYDLSIFCAPNSNGVVNVRLERLGTAFVYETTLTPTVVGTQTPASTVFMGHRIWRTNNATLLATAVDISHVYTEQDY